jgi:hypothetical protein
MFVLTVIFEHHRLSITNVPMATFFCSPYNLLYRNLSDFVLESIFIYGIVVGYKDPSYTAKYISRKRVLLTLPCSNSKPNSTNAALLLVSDEKTLLLYFNKVLILRDSAIFQCLFSLLRCRL